MKSVFALCIVLASCFKAYTQEYRLGYEGASLPELYGRTHVFAEQKINGEFKPMPARRYKLTTTEATLKGDELSYNIADIYHRKGILHFLLTVDGKQLPLTLNLPILEEIRYNLYTDSIKPILNYYLNVEGKFSNGRYFPLDTTFVTVSASEGSMRGLEWILPKEHHFDKVTFTTTHNFDPSVSKSVTLYLKKYKDPRDAIDYQDKSEEDIINNTRKKR